MSEWGSMCSAEIRRPSWPRIAYSVRVRLVFQRSPCVWRPRRSSSVRIHTCFCIPHNLVNAVALKVVIATSLRVCMGYTSRKCGFLWQQVYRYRNIFLYDIALVSTTRIRGHLYSGVIRLGSGIRRQWYAPVVTGTSSRMGSGVSLYPRRYCTRNPMTSCPWRNISRR